MSFLHIENLSKSYRTHTVVDQLSLTLAEQQTLGVLGKSGCGKTTLLKIIAGVEQQDSGQISIAGESITDMPPQKRGVVYLYQEDLLFPHLTVRENIGFGLQLKKVNSSAIDDQVDKMIHSLQLDGHGDKRPSDLSGGQRQRVAFGRAIIIQPRLLLLDEPFGSLDTTTRTSMQALFKQITSQYKITSIFVTHDLKEALLMGDQISRMEAGQLTIYDSQAAFINDTRTGVQEEITFWKQLNQKA